MLDHACIQLHQLAGLSPTPNAITLHLSNAKAVKLKKSG